MTNRTNFNIPTCHNYGYNKFKIMESTLPNNMIRNIIKNNSKSDLNN